MTRIAGFLAATLAAALTGGLCLMIGWRLGRDAKPDRELRDQGYVESHGWFV